MNKTSREMKKKNNNNNEVYAAIALALHEFCGNNVHDSETGVITLQHKNTQWNERFLTMRHRPA